MKLPALGGTTSIAALLDEPKREFAGFGIGTWFADALDCRQF